MMLAETLTLENGLLFFGAMLALTFFSLNLARRNRRRAAQAQTATRQQIRKLSGEREYPSIADKVMVQLEELSRRVSAAVDTRFAKLECVIREADERAARLEKLLVHEGDAPTGDSHKTPHTAVATAGTTESKVGEAARPAPELPPRVRRVYELADKGEAPLAIAEALELPLGEVELILDLRAMR